jgi:DNA-binding MarR family transcriptional regulator
MNTDEKEDSLTLEILETINKKGDVTQRHLANVLGVALGLTNSYLKRCVRKGLVKIHQAPANRYFYYLTPKGFTEKSRLTALYLTKSFDFYRDTSKSITSIYDECHQRGWSRLLFYGLSELAEIAYVRAQEFDIKVVGTWDSNTSKELFLGLPVWHEFHEIPNFEFCLLTSFSKTKVKYDELLNVVDAERIFVPEILGFSPLND